MRNGKAIPSKAILRQDKLSRIFVGAGALDSPLGGARFELSRAYVENIMWITQMRLSDLCKAEIAPLHYRR